MPSIWVITTVIIVSTACCHSNLTCPGDWQFYENSCYLLRLNASTYPQAKEGCNNIGAHLASIETESENRFTYTLIKNSNGYLWVGLKWNVSSNCPQCDLWIRRANWIWDDGTPVGQFHNWTNKSEGSHPVAYPRGEFTCGCVRIRHKYWVDSACDTKYPYMCEGEPTKVKYVTEPPTTESPTSDSPTKESPKHAPPAEAVVNKDNDGNDKGNSSVIAGAVIGGLILLLLLLLLLVLLLMRRRKRKRKETKGSEEATEAIPEAIVATAPSTQQYPYILDPAIPIEVAAVGFVKETKVKSKSDLDDDDDDYDLKKPKGKVVSNDYEPVEPSTSGLQSKGHDNSGYINSHEVLPTDQMYVNVAETPGEGKGKGKAGKVKSSGQKDSGPGGAGGAATEAMYSVPKNNKSKVQLVDTMYAVPPSNPRPVEELPPELPQKLKTRSANSDHYI